MLIPPLILASPLYLLTLYFFLLIKSVSHVTVEREKKTRHHNFITHMRHVPPAYTNKTGFLFAFCVCVCVDDQTISPSWKRVDTYTFIFYDTCCPFGRCHDGNQAAVPEN
jgi:hypothetical protein